MITLRELATTLAAMMYWKEEIAHSGNQSAGPHLKAAGMPSIKPLTTYEVEQLPARLRSFPVTD